MQFAVPHPFLPSVRPLEFLFFLRFLKENNVGEEQDRAMFVNYEAFLVFILLRLLACACSRLRASESVAVCEVSDLFLRVFFFGCSKVENRIRVLHFSPFLPFLLFLSFSLPQTKALSTHFCEIRW